MLSAILLAAIKKSMATRYDGAPQLRYFFPRDFGMESEPFSFRSGQWLLRGEIVLPKEEPKAVVFFFHGLGAGHTAYTQEICALAKQGYVVYTYDNTGCMTSEGATAGFLNQSLLDQKAFFDYFEASGRYKDLPRYAVGHSWGGYTALGSLIDDHHIDKVVSISGFLSVPQMVIDTVPQLGKFEDLLCKALRKGYGKYGDVNMLDVMEKSDARILYVGGDNDPMVKPEISSALVAKKFEGSKRVRLLLIEGAMHQPYWTLQAQAYYAKIKKEANIFAPDFDNAFEVDYGKLNEDNPKVMGKIFAFLAS